MEENILRDDFTATATAGESIGKSLQLGQYWTSFTIPNAMFVFNASLKDTFFCAIDVLINDQAMAFVNFLCSFLSLQ